MIIKKGGYFIAKIFQGGSENGNNERGKRSISKRKTGSNRNLREK